MTLDPMLADQTVLAETRRRATDKASRRDLLAQVCLVLLFLAGTAGLFWWAPPTGVAWLETVICLLVLVASMGVQFETPFGFTVATQLAFVPLVFVVAPALVPVAVLLAVVLSGLPDMVRRRVSWVRLLKAFGNSCFALGPAWVFAVAGPARHATPWILIAAFGAQLVADFLGSALYFGIARGASIRSQLRETWWVWVIDTALATVGLAVAGEMDRFAPAVLAVVPLLGVLEMFARERTGRLEGLLELGETYRGTALLLGDVVEADDSYTGLHSQGVVDLALSVGKVLGLEPEALRNLEFAALLHDVGKIAIPKTIINKPGKLDAEEWVIMKTHAAEGQRMLDRVGGFMIEVGRIVRSHHERWDGGGYPDGLLADAAPLESRIITCCDSWSAMRTDRPYRAAMSQAAAEREILDHTGRQFDPAVARALLAVVRAEYTAAAGPVAGVVPDLDPNAVATATGLTA